MRTALVIYESWFGSTRMVAAEIAHGLRAADLRATSMRVGSVSAEDIRGADLIVVGAPTHAHGLPSAATRAQAPEWAADQRKQLTLDAEPTSGGVREWLGALPDGHGVFAAFSTRADVIELLSGSAAHAISRRLRRKGWRELDATESFVVPRIGNVEEAELRRAEAWGLRLQLALRALSASEAHDPGDHQRRA